MRGQPVAERDLPVLARLEVHHPVIVERPRHDRRALRLEHPRPLAGGDPAEMDERRVERHQRHAALASLTSTQRWSGYQSLAAPSSWSRLGFAGMPLKSMVKSCAVEPEREGDEHRLGIEVVDLVEHPVDVKRLRAGIERVRDPRRADAGRLDVERNRGAPLVDRGSPDGDLCRAAPPPGRVPVANVEVGVGEVVVVDGEPPLRRVHLLVDVLPRPPALVLAGEVVAEILVEELDRARRSSDRSSPGSDGSRSSRRRP